MHIVKLAVALIMILPLVSGAESSEAAELWTAEHGTGLVAGATFPEEIVAGQQFSATLHLAKEVESVRYQICSIGNACFASNLELERSGNNWTLDTAKIPDQLDFIDKPQQFEEGERIGVQFFIKQGNETVLFPHGRDCDPRDPELESTEAWVACDETHYFGTNVIAGEKQAPGLGFLALLVVIALVMKRE
jgi:hypothetical protein